MKKRRVKRGRNVKRLSAVVVRCLVGTREYIAAAAVAIKLLNAITHVHIVANAVVEKNVAVRAAKNSC